MTDEERRQVAQAATSAQHPRAANTPSRQPISSEKSRETAREAVDSSQMMTDARKSELERKTKVLETPERPDYQGHDTGWEYDKFIGKERELRGNKSFSNAQKISHTDQRAYHALLSAGHDPNKAEKAIGERSLNTIGRKPEQQQEYASAIRKNVENNPGAVKSIQETQRLRANRGLSNDNRLQSIEIAERQQAITEQRNVYGSERVHDPRHVSSAEIYRSNHQSRQSQKLAESEERRDIELAKTHVDDRADNIQKAGTVVETNSPRAANHYSPKKQKEYGQAVAAKAYREQQQEQRPDPQRESLNHLYASSESHYRSTRQAYYQHQGLSEKGHTPNGHNPSRSR